MFFLDSRRSLVKLSYFFRSLVFRNLGMSAPQTSQTKEYPICHIKQRYHWDCGVTCVMMLLSDNQKESFEDICREEGFGQSTWTIDLCYLLKRFGIRHKMYTTMLGVNESHIRHSYYSRVMDLDRERVKKRFSLASSNGIQVALECVSIDMIINHVKGQGPVILLIDAGLLSCDLCKHNKIGAEFRRWFGGSYKGHYILLSGWSSGRIMYKDPSRDVPVCASPAWRVDVARQASGTDHDAIFVFSK